MANTNETNVICPNCGARVAIPSHEHLVSGVCIAKDSGPGNVYLQLEDRRSQLEERGIDTTNYFSIKSPTGNDVLMKWENGVPRKADDDDPVVVAIRKAYVPNRRLFRRWVMAQMFRGLSQNRGGFTSWMKRHGYLYTWKQVIEEFRVQVGLFHDDKENYAMRSRWFNKNVLYYMCVDYIAQLEKYIESRPVRSCKRRPYKRIFSKNIFVDEIESKLLAPMRQLADRICQSALPGDLYRLAKEFRDLFPGCNEPGFKQCYAWQEGYKGAGAYFTLRNLIMFHGCVWRGCTGQDDSLRKLDEYAVNCEGYEMLGALKVVIRDNNIDIQKKMAEWKK